MYFRLFIAHSKIKYVHVFFYNFKEAQGDALLSKGRLHLYAISSGTPVWSGSGNSIVNTLDGLDWKRAFAIILWFLSTPSSSIADALADYESAFSGHPQYGQYANAPIPAYDDHLGNAYDISNPSDIKYHLLKVPQVKAI